MEFFQEIFMHMNKEGKVLGTYILIAYSFQGRPRRQVPFPAVRNPPRQRVL